MLGCVLSREFVWDSLFLSPCLPPACSLTLSLKKGWGNFVILEQLKVHSGIEGKVQRVPTYFLSPSVDNPHLSEPALTGRHHPESTGFALGGVCSVGLTDV